MGYGAHIPWYVRYDPQSEQGCDGEVRSATCPPVSIRHNGRRMKLGCGFILETVTVPVNRRQHE